MTERLHCDAAGCERVARDEYAPGWLVADTVEPLSAIGEEDGPWHFCSAAHLALWALAATDAAKVQP